MTPARDAFLSELDARAAAGRPLVLWLRDDDAVEPTPALDRLLGLMGALPLTLAVIPAATGPALARHLAGRQAVSVAVHGWSHRNHAGPVEKSQELGAHRPAATVLAELGAGARHLSALHGDRALPLLVPPWNRIAPGVIAGLRGAGFAALSTFGPQARAAGQGLAEVNSHLDIIDWRGTRGGRPAEALWSEALGLARMDLPALGVLSHHLVHDGAAWAFLEDLVALTASHPGAVWPGVARIIAKAQDPGS
ncbi:polysaccharide deacetylase family protein [Frigidibacter sp. MR17.14]|uniref:polysaccharide deacetylase family protein n=1 Tax=Frigidibacter sp. MR17.14 TaxID=3126509 RepID=UPI0030131474